MLCELGLRILRLGVTEYSEKLEFKLGCICMCKISPICKNNKSKTNYESAIGQHLIANPECNKTDTEHNFRIIGQARSSFHSSALESVYNETQNPVLCRQKEFVFSQGLFK